MDAEERRAFLDRSCAQDAELRSNVEALLASDRNAGEFLAAPAIHLSCDPETDDFDDYWLAGVWARIRSCARSATEAWEPSTWRSVRTANTISRLPSS